MAGNWDRRSKKLLMAGLGIYDLFRPLVHRLEDMTWRWRRKPYPPPPFKQRTVRAYGKRFALDTLVETGTYLGDMVQNTKDAFARIISIELDERLCARARRRFARFAHITILQGDSAEILPQVLAGIDRPSLFWLDAHYSAGITTSGPLDTPIVSELRAILSHRVPNHVILIDDARVFDGRNGYPEIPILRRFLLDRRPGWHWEVQDDIMRFHPASP
jgi:hypothetical protein